MALDTQYRPRTYTDVLGQESTVQILREFVRTGSGFHQSYLFAGGHGSGKTTLGRILCRALLCDAPVGGEPCDACHSCQSILTTGASDAFTEFDAATNSTKEDIRRITEMAAFETLSGKRRVYLIDEAHRLSPQALDALLKPMEDCAQGSEDKKLVCVFCTTEPEKMRRTIFSRCAPAFIIRMVSPAGIAARLALVCAAEGLAYEESALVLIAEATECHIRDALKAVEGVSMVGDSRVISVENVRSYLRLDANDGLLNLLLTLGEDLGQSLAASTRLGEFISPAVAYERLAEAAMLAFKVWIGSAKPPSYWDLDTLNAIGKKHTEFLIRLAEVFASRPMHPTQSMLECDVARLHHVRRGTWHEQVGPRFSAIGSAIATAVFEPPPVVPAAPVSVVLPPVVTTNPPMLVPVVTTNPPMPAEVQIAGRVVLTPPGVDVRADPASFMVNGRFVLRAGVNRDESDADRINANPAMDPAEFRGHVRRHVRELALSDGRRRSA